MTSRHLDPTQLHPMVMPDGTAVRQVVHLSQVIDHPRIAVGDFSYYHIVDALNMQVQRLTELYAESNQTGYIGRAEVDGMPVLEEAFARLKNT